mmetsp:Transcript_12629/g.28836  ORF Transcript_12629/g.28836 Transcript_12629/m.28836 type:complete len:271 (-) Transcript_12629:17-829(-)
MYGGTCRDTSRRFRSDDLRTRRRKPDESPAAARSRTSSSSAPPPSPPPPPPPLPAARRLHASSGRNALSSPYCILASDGIWTCSYVNARLSLTKKKFPRSNRSPVPFDCPSPPPSGDAPPDSFLTNAARCESSLLSSSSYLLTRSRKPSTTHPPRLCRKAFHSWFWRGLTDDLGLRAAPFPLSRRVPSMTVRPLGKSLANLAYSSFTSLDVCATGPGGGAAASSAPPAPPSPSPVTTTPFLPRNPPKPPGVPPPAPLLWLPDVPPGPTGT